MSTALRRGLAAGVLLALAVPPAASADTLEAVGNEVLGDTVAINTMWVLIAAVLVLFMQAGFAMLEIGFSRTKNAGTGVAKILTNLAIAAICYWAVGFAFAFGNGDLIGDTGFFLRGFGDPQEAFGVMGLSDATIEAKWLFQFAFCAVSLAIVWGSTLERIKYGAYVVYAVVFASIIYPIGSHWVFGGGWLQSNVGMQDFAGSTAVHLIGATGAFAALLLLGPRKGKYGPDGRPRAIPGHSMPLVGLGTIILFVGWFGFNAGSTLGVTDVRFGEVALVTLLGGLGGVLGAFVATQAFQRTIDIGMVANGLIAGLVAITAPSGYVEAWPAPIIGFVGGIVVVVVVVVDVVVVDVVVVVVVVIWLPARSSASSPVAWLQAAANTSSTTPTVCRALRIWPPTVPPQAIATVSATVSCSTGRHLNAQRSDGGKSRSTKRFTVRCWLSTASPGCSFASMIT